MPLMRDATLFRMGFRSSGGTFTPAIMYLKMSAWCSNSAHCTDVNGARPALIMELCRHCAVPIDSATFMPPPCVAAAPPQSDAPASSKLAVSQSVSHTHHALHQTSHNPSSCICRLLLCSCHVLSLASSSNDDDDRKAGRRSGSSKTKPNFLCLHPRSSNLAAYSSSSSSFILARRPDDRADDLLATIPRALEPQQLWDTIMHVIATVQNSEHQQQKQQATYTS